MSTREKAEGAIARAESSAADTHGNLEDALRAIQRPDRAGEVIEWLEWAKRNASTMTYHLDEALTAARKLVEARGA